jgi:hypothetical protein
MKKDCSSELTVNYLPIECLTAYSNTIIAGHGRVHAAKLLGMKLVPTIRLESMTQDQIRAYVIADNRLAEKAGWDHSILAIELQHLLTIDSDLDVTNTGFEIPEIDLILEEASGKQRDDDVFNADETSHAVTRRGDLWQLGKHRILCANSLEEASYKALMGGHRAELVFVDPPYNVAIDGHASGNGSFRCRFSCCRGWGRTFSPSPMPASSSSMFA